MSERSGRGVWFDRILGVAVLAMMGALLVQPGGSVRSRIDSFLSDRQVQRVLGDRWHEIAGFDASDPPARHVIVEFMDYQCPFCRRAEDTLSAYARTKDFEVVYRHYPVAVLHLRAEEAARVAICADEQGVFQEVHTYLIREEWWDDPVPLDARSAELGIADTAVFRQCLTSQRLEERLAADRKLGDILNVQGTPLFVGPKGVHRGLISGAEIEDLVGSSKGGSGRGPEGTP